MRGHTLKLVVIAVLIAVLGVISIYSSTYQREGKTWQIIYTRQILWLVLGIFSFFIMAYTNYRRLWDLTYFLYGIALALLLSVFILGIVRLGAQRWLRFAWFNFQPTEMVKIIMVIFLARYFSAKSINDISLQVSRYGIVKALFIPLSFIAVPVALIIEQPDLGSGVIICLIFLAMLFLGNVRLRYLGLIFVIAVLAFPVFWHYLRDYQKDRLMVFLNPNIDPLGAGYTVIQSKIAIGSGGIFGKGWLAGTQSQLHFLPESHTDFIFSTFTEAWGLLGGLAVIFLYYQLVSQAISIGEKCGDSFARLLAFGIASMLGIQVFINIAMNLGLAPVVGVPLPLMSYGGSSVIVTFISLGILANISKSRA